MPSNRKNINFKQERTRVYDYETKDTYRERTQYRESTLCTSCGALYRNGRWSWDEIPVETHEGTCPACLRMAENYPAGIVELGGSFFGVHREEIVNLIRNTAALELREHPLERIMDMLPSDSDGDAMTVRTTGMHLARRIGDALHKAYQGTLNFNYGAETYVRVHWNR